MVSKQRGAACAGTEAKPRCGHRTVTVLAAVEAAPASTDWDTERQEIARLFANGEFSLEMQVRDYELDQFNVVNNAVYASYFQHGRHEALASLGHDVDDYARRGSPLALSEMRISFKAPLRSRDVFRVTFRIDRITAARLVVKQRILKKRRPQGLAAAGRLAHSSGGPTTAPALDGGPAEGEEAEELVAEAEVVVVFLDANYRATRIPPDALRVFHEIASRNPS